MDSAPINLTGFGKILHIESNTIYKWYRDVLSDYAKDGGQSVHENDITIKDKSIEKTIRVPIFREENIGSKMAIDEKQIGEDIYTIMSNRETGKIAMVCQSLKFNEINQVLQKHKNALSVVKSFTRDFSLLYRKVGNEIFPKALQVIDKFHIIKNLMEAHQDIRVKYRQKELDKRRKAYKEFKEKEKQRLQECELTGKKFKAKKFYYKEQRHENRETTLELLARSRYLLYKFKSQWTKKQENRAKILFKLFPEIEKSYDLTCQFRDFMSKKNIGKHYLQITKQLYQWYDDVEDAQIDEMLNFKTLIEINEQQILNYFNEGETNAMAEAINRKIQKFISSNQGTRDRDFFFFRLNLYFALAHQNII